MPAAIYPINSMEKWESGADANPIAIENTQAAERLDTPTTQSIRYIPTICAIFMSRGNKIPERPAIKADIKITKDIISSFDTWSE